MTTKYSISKHRFYELKHWCLQYHEWEELYSQLDGYETEQGDTTSKEGMLRAELRSRMDLIRKICIDTDDDIWESLLRTVIGDANLIPTSSYIYKKFFWLLDKARDQ